MVTVALAGNPNCGKTTLFNGLTGARHHVGNWPGVTVERRSGQVACGGTALEVVDLPGTYSLAARSEDERIAAHFLSVGDETGHPVDVLVNVLDASNLERNLYLTTQLLELRKPMVFVLNMMDDAEAKGIRFDLPALETLLGGPVIPTVGNREEGIQALKDALVAVSRGEHPALRDWSAAAPGKGPVEYGHDIEGELGKIEAEVRKDEPLGRSVSPRWMALLLLEGSPEGARLLAQSHAREAVEAQVAQSVAFLEAHLGDDTATLIAERRYGFAHGLVSEVLSQPAQPARAFKDRLDGVLTHRWFGIPIFLAVMGVVYVLSFTLGKYPQDWIGEAFKALSAMLSAKLPPGELTSLLVDGVIPGVSTVVVFLPVIMILMGCISFLEDTGYMARAAFIMDRVMHLMGLHGKSFIPLIMGSGCNVPAIQATRTIESRQDRLITILVTPLVSCSARYQVFVVIAGSFFVPWKAGLVVLGLQFGGMALAVLMGRLLRSTLFAGPSAPFVMELPPYRLPVLKTTAIHMWEKGSVFLKRAGTTIFAGATLVWFVSRYPGIANREWALEYRAQQAQVEASGLPGEAREARLADLKRAYESRIVNTSLAARMGRKVEPLLRPIVDPEGRRAEAWKDVIALTAGFVAKEIVVSTMAVIHQASEDPAEGSLLSPLQQTLRDRSGWTPLTALAFMVFTLIYTPCLGTVSMIRREAGGWRWAGFTVAYGLGLGWLLAFATVQAGRLLGLA